ncbi:MAG: GyrI-like domain-containing protein [Rhodoferax sp.]|nr:GyrI-like domain-containing protein [Rhodoferax sp.]
MVQVPDEFVARSPASIATLPGGRYAVAAFEGTVPQLTVAWTELLRDWLPASGMALDGRPLFEHMPPRARYDAATGVMCCELCIPVLPLE